ncbi:MAG: APC family permease, partial [Smithellaceae bacterium]|nr:APC family permease [Smithellaceae bacterium]
ILFFSFVNYRGIRWGGTTQDLFTMGALSILVVFIVGGLLSSGGSWGHFSTQSVAAPEFSRLLGGPMIAVIFTYSGWFASTYIGSEIRNPRKNLPLSLIIGTLTVTALYCLMNVTYLYGLPLPEMKGVLNVAARTAEVLFSPTFSYAITLAIVLAIASSINANALGAARIYYAMAQDGIFWSRLGEVHPRFGTPHVAIASQALLATLLVSLGTFAQLLGYVVFFMLFTSIMTAAAVFILRRNKPTQDRPYRTLGYPFVPLVFIVAYVWIAARICTEQPGTSFLGFAIAASGVPFYLLWARGKRAPVGEETSLAEEMAVNPSQSK